MDESAVDGVVNIYRGVARLGSANTSAVLEAKEACEGDCRHGNVGLNPMGSCKMWGVQ